MNTTYFLNLVSGNIFKTKTLPALPSKLYLGLSGTQPQLDGTGVTEPPNSAGYSRVELTNMSAPQNGVVTNQQSINFAESTADWGTITHFTVYDAKTGGNLLMYDNLNKKRTVEADTVMTIKPESLSLSVVNPTA